MQDTGKTALWLPIGLPFGDDDPHHAGRNWRAVGERTSRDGVTRRGTRW
jgi:hypothetical protein